VPPCCGGWCCNCGTELVCVTSCRPPCVLLKLTTFCGRVGSLGSICCEKPVAVLFTTAATALLCCMVVMNDWVCCWPPVACCIWIRCCRGFIAWCCATVALLMVMEFCCCCRCCWSWDDWPVAPIIPRMLDCTKVLAEVSPSTKRDSDETKW